MKKQNLFTRFFQWLVKSFVIFDNIGMTIKRVAQTAVIILAIVNLTLGVILYVFSTFALLVVACVLTYGIGLLAFPIILAISAVLCALVFVPLILLALVATWVIFAPIYAFGELVDMATQTKKNTDLLVQQYQKAE